MRRLIALAVLAPLLAAGCARDKDARPDPQAQTQAVGPSAAVAPAASGGTISSAGYGPYRLGTALPQLAGANLVTGQVTEPGGCASASGTAAYGSPALVFQQGKLEQVQVSAGNVLTGGGVGVGSAYGKVKSGYPDGTALSDQSGDQGWLVADGANGLLFLQAQGVVVEIDAAPVTMLKAAFAQTRRC